MENGRGSNCFNLPWYNWGVVLHLCVCVWVRPRSALLTQNTITGFRRPWDDGRHLRCGKKGGRYRCIGLTVRHSKQVSFERERAEKEWDKCSQIQKVWNKYKFYVLGKKELWHPKTEFVSYFEGKFLLNVFYLSNNNCNFSIACKLIINFV